MKLAVDILVVNPATFLRWSQGSLVAQEVEVMKNDILRKLMNLDNFLQGQDLFFRFYRYQMEFKAIAEHFFNEAYVNSEIGRLLEISKIAYQYNELLARYKRLIPAISRITAFVSRLSEKASILQRNLCKRATGSVF